MLPLVLICFSLIAADDGVATPPEDSAQRAAYEAARAKAGHDAKAHVRLALWCEAHGLNAERMKHLATAVLYDPSNGLARGLMGLVAYQGKWARPDEVSRQAQDDPTRKALIQEYLQRRAMTPNRIDDQWKLAVWCERNGLKDQAIAQYHAVLRRDPSRESAWKRLGFKKVGGLWIKPEWQAAQKQESEQQTRANKRWKPSLEKWGAALSSHDRVKRAEAEGALLSVVDPRAVPSIWSVFLPKGPEGQKVAVELLGQIDSPASSRALALLALIGAGVEVRREAAQILRRRDPRDFAPFLIGLIRDPIQYEVKPVQGPGSPGELVITNPGASAGQLYAGLPQPNFAVQPGDRMVLDANGLPVVNRTTGFVNQLYLVKNNSHDHTTDIAIMQGIVIPMSPAEVSQIVRQGGPTPAQSYQLGKTIMGYTNGGSPVSINQIDVMLHNHSVHMADEWFRQYVQIPVGQMELDVQRSARTAQQQLVADARTIDRYNVSIRDSNRPVRQILSETLGTDHGDDVPAWSSWLAGLFGYAYPSRNSSYEASRIGEEVSPSDQPPAQPDRDGTIAIALSHHACLGAGTLAQTFDGPRAIQDLRAGDEVITQNSRTGELKYQPLVAVFHNPPNSTFRVELDGETIVATGIHRLWKAGKGWTMVRELKPGDVLRTLGGTVAVKSVVAEKVQPVFNLRVADGESFFVGRSGVLAHDNSTINPTPEPFDAVAPVTGSGPTAPRSLLGR